jgi:hypothetical protein
LSSSPAIPMPIRNYSPRNAVPPPLPPPRILKELNSGHDLGWQWANGKINRDSSDIGSIPLSSPIRSGAGSLKEVLVESRPEDVSENAYATGSRPPFSLSLPLHGKEKVTDQSQTQRPVLPR